MTFAPYWFYFIGLALLISSAYGATVTGVVLVVLLSSVALYFFRNRDLSTQFYVVSALFIFKLLSFFASGSISEILISGEIEELKYFVALMPPLLASVIYLNEAKLTQYSLYASTLSLCALLFCMYLKGVSAVAISHHMIGGIALLAFMQAAHVLIRPSGMWNRFIAFWLAAASVLAVLQAESRTALIACCIYSFSYLFVSFRVFRKVVTPALLLLSFFLGSKFFLPSNYIIEVGGRTLDVAAFEHVEENFTAGFEYGFSANSARDFSFFAGEVTDFNLQARFFLFGKAIALFLESPVIGVGVGRFDDSFYCADSMSPLLCLPVNAVQNNSGQTAHSTYLHLLAEEGVVGLFGMLTLLYVCYHRVSDGERPQVTAMVMTLLGISIVNHAVGSPIYTVALLGPIILLSNKRRRK